MNRPISTFLATSATEPLSALYIFYLFAVVLPVVLPFVRRATPVVLVAAAVLVLIHIIRVRDWKRWRSELSSTPALLGFCFLIWAAVTCLWAPNTVRAWQAVASGTLIFFSALCVNMFLHEPNQRSRLHASIAMSVAALTIIVDLKSGGFLLHLIHSRPEPYRYNMVLVSLVVLSFGLFRKGIEPAQPAKYVALIILSGAVWIGESETAKLSMLVGYAFFLLSLFVPRCISLCLFFGGILCAWGIFLLKPELLTIASNIWPSLAEQGHAAERVQIWLAYSKFALAGMPWGWGVESVSHVPLTSYYATAPDLLKPDLEWLHPHNNVLQIVAETGWLGSILASAASLLLMIWAHSNEQLRMARTGFVAAVFIIALVSHGFWQMWFWSAVAVTYVLLGREVDNKKS